MKSLVFVAPEEDGSVEPLICLVSGPNRVDLARLAAVAGEPDVRRASANEARELTGFTIGGIPPIGHPRNIRVIMDPDLGRFPVVWAAAGLPTAVFPVAPATLRMLSNAHVAPICEERRQADILAEGSTRGDAPSVNGPPERRRRRLGAWPANPATRSSAFPAASAPASAGPARVEPPTSSR